jgi:hypothetical protein
MLVSIEQRLGVGLERREAAYDPLGSRPCHFSTIVDRAVAPERRV